MKPVTASWRTTLGEIGFNAIYAGLLGIPVALVTGDEAAAKETELLLPDTVKAIVKRSLSRTAAICLSLEESRSELMTRTKEAENTAALPLGDAGSFGGSNRIISFRSG